MLLRSIVQFIQQPEQFEFRIGGSKVEYLNEAGNITDDAVFFVAGFEFGPRYLIHVESYRGDGFEDAWTAFVDALPEISGDDLIEALRPEGDGDSFEDMARDELLAERPKDFFSGEFEDWRAKVVARAKELLAAYEGPEPVEGYECNSSGGLVYVGHYAWMNGADLAEVEIVRRDTTAEEDAA